MQFGKGAFLLRTKSEEFCGQFLEILFHREVNGTLVEDLNDFVHWFLNLSA